MECGWRVVGGCVCARARDMDDGRVGVGWCGWGELAARGGGDRVCVEELCGRQCVVSVGAEKEWWMGERGGLGRGLVWGWCEMSSRWRR